MTLRERLKNAAIGALVGLITMAMFGAAVGVVLFLGERFKHTPWVLAAGFAAIPVVVLAVSGFFFPGEPPEPPPS